MAEIKVIRQIIQYITIQVSYNYCIEGKLRGSLGVIRDNHVCRVKLKFKAPVVYMPKTTTYHPSQQIEEVLPDGSVIVVYEVCGLAELTSWIIQWGDNVEVLEPQELRVRVRDTVLRIAKMYD